MALCLPDECFKVDSEGVEPRLLGKLPAAISGEITSVGVVIVEVEESIAIELVLILLAVFVILGFPSCEL